MPEVTWFIGSDGHVIFYVQHACVTIENIYTYMYYINVHNLCTRYRLNLTY